MWYTATSASVTNGSDVVTITTGDDISIVQENSGLVFEDSSPVEVLKAYIDTGGNKVIQLAKPWPYSTKTNQPLVAYPTDADFAAATAELRRVIDSLEKAGTTEAQAGTDDEKFMTALKTKQSIDFNTGTAAAADVTTSSTDTTAGRVVTVGYGGLGGARMAKATYGNDLSEIISGTEYPKYNNKILEVAVDTTGKPSIATPNIAGYAQVYGQNILLTAGFPTSEVGNTYIGTWNGSEIDWRKQYDSGNTNFNEIGGPNAGDQLGSVIFRNSSTLFFVKDTSGSSIPPVSMTVEGTFKIVNQNNVDVLTGITSSDLILDVLTSPKRLKVRINNVDTSLFNFGGDTTYELAIEVAGSKITVNY